MPSFINLKIQGHEELKQKYLQGSIAIEKAMKSDLSEIGRVLKKHVTTHIRKISGSKRQTRYNPKRTVTVSNPNSYPNHDLGGLIRSIRAFVTKSGTGRHVLSFQANAPYALDLEFGTRNMRKRPFMRPTLQANRKKISAIITKGVKNAL